MKFHTVSFEDWTKSDSFRETQQTKQLNTEANNSAFKLLQPVLKLRVDCTHLSTQLFHDILLNVI